jgi:hypothetical protein
MEMEKFAALKKAKEAGDGYPSKYCGNETPCCPHCGQECDVRINDWWRLYEEGEHEVSCPHCAGDFTVSTWMRHSFSTDEQGDAV